MVRFDPVPSCDLLCTGGLPRWQWWLLPAATIRFCRLAWCRGELFSGRGGCDAGLRAAFLFPSCSSSAVRGSVCLLVCLLAGQSASVSMRSQILPGPPQVMIEAAG